jgi:hypothetical protein
MAAGSASSGMEKAHLIQAHSEAAPVVVRSVGSCDRQSASAAAIRGGAGADWRGVSGWAGGLGAVATAVNQPAAAAAIATPA